MSGNTGFYSNTQGDLYHVREREDSPFLYIENQYIEDDNFKLFKTLPRDFKFLGCSWEDKQVQAVASKHQAL